MATVLSLQERLEVAQEIADLANRGVDNFRTIIALEESLQKREFGLDEVFAKTQMEGLIQGSRDSYTIIDNVFHNQLLNTSRANNALWPAKFSPAFTEGLDSFKIDNLASPPTITANGDSSVFSFASYAVADIINISGAEEPEHNGRAIITIISGGVMTLTAGDLPGTGVVNTTDTTATVLLRER